MAKAKILKLYRESLTIRIGHPLLKVREELSMTPSSISITLPTPRGNWLDVVIDFENGDMWNMSYQGDFLVVWPEST